MPEINRELIGSVELDKTKNGKPVANLYSTDTRLQFPALRLFDLSALLTVGIDPEELGTERVHRRFWAYYAESDKTNAQGNAYKDVVALEPINAPATTSSVDTSALLAELRAIRALLEVLLDTGAPVPEPALRHPGADSKGPAWVPFDEDEEGQDEEPGDLDREFGPRPIPRNGESPTTPEALLNVLRAEGLPFTAEGHILYAIKKNSTITTWPEPTDAAGWAEVERLAREYAHAYL